MVADRAPRVIEDTRPKDVAVQEKGPRAVWRGTWADALRAMSLGWDLGVPICGGALLGNWLERRFGIGYQVTIGLLVLGVMVGFYNVGRTLAREIERDRYRSQCEEEEDGGSCQDSAGSS